MENNLRNGEQYANFDDFVKGVDLSVWDMATACGSCHVGGGLVEFDREGTRLSMRMFGGQQPLNAYDWYAYEMFDPATGAPVKYNSDMGANMPIHSNGTPASIVPGFGAAQAMWSMPATTDFKPLRFDLEGNPVNAVMAPQAWIQAENPYIALGMAVEGQAVMPNVREMDCLFCHMEGYNNIVSSVATQMGYLMAAPSLGSGLMNMFTFAYDPSKITQDFNSATGMTTAWLKGSTLAKIKPEPPEANCRQCHIPTTMANFSDMFDKFLAAAPMSYNPASPNASAINGMMMPSFDLNSPFVPQGSFSPEVFLNPMTPTWWFYNSPVSNQPANGPFGIFPMALNMGIDIMGAAAQGEKVGGGTPGQMGPLLYDGRDPLTGAMDQNALKKATIPFPRADFFKRGDNWDGVEDDVHYNLGCAGCHFNTNSLNTDLTQCDPGRGFSFMGGIENGLAGVIPDTRSTVKRCQDCHITGTNYEGQSIQTFGAQNPTAAHTRAGLLNAEVQAMGLNVDGSEKTFMGNHLDVIACQTCHVKKAKMAVRALDSTSGNRYPSIIGIQSQYGMMSMFTDPMPDHSMKFEPTEWKPLYMWDDREQKLLPNGSVNPDWRREIVPVNMITAALWDASGNPDIDANGDGAETHGIPGISILWDPQISRNMKAGMNFAPGPFATIPVGFGGEQYASAYDANFNFTGAFDYVGIYGGNIILTNPDEISTYKTMRGASWEGTQLVYYGGNPFQIEHGIARVNVAALGKGGCVDCHAPGTGFFSGPYDMTGTAIPASEKFFNPMLNTDATNMMQRPAVDIEIAGSPADLRTGSEAKAKINGQVLDVKFEEKGTWDSTTKTFTPAADGAYIRTTDLNRSEYLYPHPEHGVSWAEFYGYSDGVTPATDLKGNSFATLEARIAYLETLGHPASADITVVGATADAVSKSIVTVTQGQVIPLAAKDIAADSYKWKVSDNGAAVVDGVTSSRTFTKIGTYLLTLTVSNAYGVSSDNIYVKVVAPYVAPEDQPVRWEGTSGYTGNLLASAFPTHTKITVAWGDLTATTTDVGAGAHTIEHTFKPVSSRLVTVDGTQYYRYPVTVRAYNGTTQVKTISLNVSIAKPL